MIYLFWRLPMNRTQAFILWIVCLVGCVVVCLMQLLQALFGSTKRSVNMAIAVDQAVNALLGGMPDETISARIHRHRWRKTEAFVNFIFGDPNHCRKAYESEMTLSHLPNEYRSG